MGIVTSVLKSLVATSDNHLSLDFSNITTQALSWIARSLGPAASSSLFANGLGKAALTSGTAYKSITLKSPIGRKLSPSGTSLTITSGSNVQTVTLAPPLPIPPPQNWQLIA